MRNKLLLILSLIIIISSCFFPENKKSKNELNCDELVCDTIDTYKMVLSLGKDTLILKDFDIPDTIISNTEYKEAKLWIEFWQCWDCIGQEVIKFRSNNNDEITRTEVFYEGNIGYSSPIYIQELHLDKYKEINLVLTGRTKIRIKIEEL